MRQMKLKRKVFKERKANMQFQHVARHSSRRKDRGQVHEKSAAGNKAQAWV